MDVSHGYAPWKGGENDSTGSKMGDADIDYHLSQGKSGAEMLAFYEANPDKQGGGGIGGSVHKRLQALAASQSNSGGGGGGGYSGGSVGTGAGGYNPGDINFNPGGIDMGGDMADLWSNEDFIRGLARERAEAYTDGSTTNQNQSIVNNIEQNVGNKGDWETNIGDNNTINNSSIGNDYSLNMGSINVANKQNQFSV